MSLDVTWGLVAGFVGSIVMAILLLPAMRMGPTVMSMIAARAMGDNPTGRRSMMGGIVFHLIYGTAMGGVFAAGITYVAKFVSPLVDGVLFGILLFIIMMVVIMPIAKASRPPTAIVWVLFIVHLIYGAIVGSLSAWLSFADILGYPI